MILRPGDLIGNYRVLDYIGEGGMGKVYAAEEELLGRKVAIKMLDAAITHQEHFRQRFLNEARILATLKHPNIVGLLRFFSEQDSYFMALEYAEGQTLRDLIATIGPVPEQRTRRILLQIMVALDYAHDKGVVHRDIKPSNIMIGDHDEVKVLDFGVARMMTGPLATQTGTRVGTVYYMSPEQVSLPREVDYRSDIYSAGVVLFELLTGRLPFSTQTESDFLIEKEIVEVALPHPREFYPYMSDIIVDLMNAMTAKQPSLRPTAADVVKALKTGSLGGIKTPLPFTDKPVPIVPSAPIPVLPKPKRMPQALRTIITIVIISIVLLTAGYIIKEILASNPGLLKGNPEEVAVEEIVPEETVSEEELAAIQAGEKRQEAKRAVRKIRPRFATIAGAAIDYQNNDPFGEWPGSLEEFIDPDEVDTEEFSFAWEEGRVVATSTRAFGKAGVTIYYYLDQGRFEIYDPDPNTLPNVEPAWLN